MAVICPTITAYDPHEYREQMERVQPFAERVHIDLMDGHFAPTKSPGLKHVWWPDTLAADIHLMYQRPLPHLPTLIKLRPRLVIIHAEADADHIQFSKDLRRVGIRAGLALLHDTPADQVKSIVKSFDHLLVFSGHLGYHGGQADLGLLDKVKELSKLNSHAEIGWDGGITDQNVRQLAVAGVDVLNVGGFIQQAEDPQKVYKELERTILLKRV
jgi:ribulose-phosphate 3-epimerase